MERLKELKKEVAAQEMKLKSLQLQQQQQCFPSSHGDSREQETMSSLIFLKEKELALALMKVAELTGQLEHLKRSENKSESPPRTAGRITNASSILRTVPTSAIQNASERCQEFNISTSTNSVHESNGTTKTVVLLQPANVEILRTSRSFDTSVASSGERNSCREQFFSPSFVGTHTVPTSLSFASYSHNGHSSRLLTAVDRSNQCSLLPVQSRDIKGVPIKLRHSTSSSIMSKFAPKPYSSRSTSVDCGIARRPLTQNSKIDSKATYMCSNSASDSTSTSKTPNICLLPKSASFHYGHTQHENSFIRKRSEELDGGDSTNPISPPTSESISYSAGVFKPRVTPKPVNLVADSKITSSAAEPLVLLNEAQSHLEAAPPPEPPKRQSRSLANKQGTRANDPLIHLNKFYDAPVVRNNLTITLTQQVTPRDSTVSDQGSHAAESNQRSSDLAEVFKKGGVKELSKMFSQLPNDGKKDDASRNEPVEVEKSALGKTSEPSLTSSSSNKPSEECLSKAGEKETNSPGHEIDISANAVSSALSILLSGSSTSRHTIASRPNRLFGYSSSFSRPKFSFVPSDKKTSTNELDKDAELNSMQQESLHNYPPSKPATIYSLFSPPPKTKLSTGSPEKFPKVGEASICKVTETKNLVKKNVFLPRLSYITLSSNLSQDGNEAETSNVKAKSKKKVTIDPSFLFLSAAVEGELDVIRSIIPQVNNPDLCNDNGMTALHMAVCNDHTEVVKFLLDYGCNVNASNHEYWTPLHYAALGNKKEIIEILLSSGACVFALTATDHETPVQKCQSKMPSCEECTKVLEDYGNQLGHANGGYVFSMAEYEAECANECSLKDGEMIRILRRGDEVESEWWWACKSSGCIISEGYVPRSVLSLHPRRPKLWKSK